MSEALRCDTARLWEAHMDMARIGALPGGGCCRLALTDADKAGRDRFVEWAKDAGCRIDVDRAGNVFARREGADPDAPVVLCGSHLDTQPHGGRFDGIFGVLAGLEVIRTLNDHGVATRAPIETVVWANEEGVRFAPGLTGSGAFTGMYALEDVLAFQATDGPTWGEELQRIGYAGAAEPGARPVDAFFEAHIEQGPVLEREGRQIGVVTGIQGIRWYEVTVTGADAHAGTTPLDARRDALVGAAEMVGAVNAIGREHAPHARMSIGRFEVSPGGPSTVPGRVFFIVDMRHPDTGVLDTMRRDLEQRLQGIAGARDLEVRIEQRIDAKPVVFDPDCVDAVRSAAATLGYGHMDMLSGAGHDAMYLARKVPTAMVFVPCEAGVSHNELESAKPEDLAAGCDVLMHAMLARAGRSESIQR